jgi:hypothetical protein
MMMMRKSLKFNNISVLTVHGMTTIDTNYLLISEARDFSSSLCVQTGSGAHPAFCPMGTGVHFRG